jgi:hypothetical protein
MFNYQPFSSSSLKDGIDAQMSLYTAMSKSFFDVSLQIGELSSQAMQNAMEAACTNFQRGWQLAAVPDMNSFFGQQLWAPFSMYSASRPAPVKPNPPAASAESDTAREDSGQGAHEVSPKPSTLVEKMIASVVEETNNADRKT